MRFVGRNLALLTVVAATVGCDRVTKALAMAHLAGEPRQSYLADALRLEYVENRGAFLGLGANFPPWARSGLFVVGAGLMLAALAATVVTGRCAERSRLALALICAGGASNLLDRVARGSVVDFINVGLGPLRTGIFNVADLAITAGVAITAAYWAAGRR